MTDSFDAPDGTGCCLSGQTVYIRDSSGNRIDTLEFSGDRYIRTWISGQAVSTTVNVDLSGATFASNVSGNIVYLTSGQNNVQMSGQTVYLASGFNAIQGSFTADISGQPVNISGNAVRISGSMISISGQPVSISGNVVVASVTTNISGQVVYLVSGNNAVQNSGQAVRISGETVQIAGGINVSGSPVRISGETIYPVSGIAFNHAFDPSGVAWNPIWVSESGGHRVLVAISGETINANTSVSGNVIVVPSTSISGNMVSVSGQVVLISGQLVAVSGLIGTSVSGNAVLISGQLVAVSGIVGTSISGNMVSVSGQPVSVSGNAVMISGSMVTISGQPVTVSGNVVNTSGNVGLEYGTFTKTNTPTVVPALSGGTYLHSGTIFSVTIRSYSGNAPMWVGGRSGEAPFSGKGIQLFGNESQVFKVDDFDRVKLFASTSGQRVSFIGVASTP